MSNCSQDVLISKEAPIRHALERLCRTAKGVLVVVEENKLIAKMTDGDIRCFC